MTPHETPPAVAYQTALNAITRAIHDADTFAEAMPRVEKMILDALDAERITVYQRGRSTKDLVSKFKSGTEIAEIRVPLTTSSIAGYVAMSQQVVCVADVYDDAALARVHADLRFGKSFDAKGGFRTRAVLAVPVKFQDTLLGVLQVLNKRSGGEFSQLDVQLAEDLAQVIGQKFRYELKATKAPFDYLIQTNRVKEETLKEFSTRSEKEGKPTYEMLITEAGVSRAEIGTSLERFYQVPFVQFDPNQKIPRDLISGVNESYLLSQRWVPLEKNGEELVVLIDDPSDATRIMEIQRLIRADRYVFKVGLPDDIRRYLGQGGETVGESADISELVGKLQAEVVEESTVIPDAVDENAATVIQLVNRLIIQSYENRASDIHIEPGKGRAAAVVRIRVDGVCRPLLSIPASHTQAVLSRIKIMSGLDISERRKPQDGKCGIRYKGQLLELRVATIPTVNGEAGVLRILASSEPLPLAKLNLSAGNFERVASLVRRPHGILLVVGPTGSGKTTTLHAILGHINTPERKIWTAEDPVEITQAGMQQVQVQPKIGLDFAAALRSFLRADPDVIMIGEMRDRETAHAAIEASLTGHLVFSTLHTNSAAETLVRLLDLGVDPVSFSDALLGVLAQRLARTLCEKCKQEYQLSESENDTLRRYYGEELYHELHAEPGKSTVYRAAGCTACGGTGYRGRVGIHELLVNDDPMRALIYKRATAALLREAAIASGMRTLMQDGIAKFLGGVTDIEQVRRVAGS